MSTSTTTTSDTPGGKPIEGLPEHVVIRQLYLGCLSQASYLVGDRSTGRAIVVDPRRDIEEILDAARSEGLQIELVAETHFHADFLSGHLELAAATGAEIGVGAAGSTEFASRALHDGDTIDLGRTQIQVLTTPGHTPESISLVVRPEPDADPVAVLTGDTLFIGDVGRPDLLVAADIPAEVLAADLRRSLHRLLDLPDDTLVLPAHGAGSACGKALSTETVSTLGAQRRTNYALQPMDEQTFIDLVTEGQPTAPSYFGYDAHRNREERPLLDEHATPAELGLDGVDQAVRAGAAIVDTRSIEEFTAAHLAGSLGVSLSGRFAEQVGSIVPVGTPIVLVGDPDRVLEAKVRLARIGYDDVAGAVSAVEQILIQNPDRAGRLSRLAADQVETRRAELGDELQFVDVRNPGEVEAAPVEGARNIPLATLTGRMDQLDRDRPVVVICAGGARSAIASSVLSANGFADVSDVLGGATALGVAAACTTTGAPAVAADPTAP